MSAYPRPVWEALNAEELLFRRNMPKRVGTLYRWSVWGLGYFYALSFSDRCRKLPYKFFLSQHLVGSITNIIIIKIFILKIHFGYVWDRLW